MAMIPWWIHYPNINNEIINLDWILQVSNENTDKIENFIGINTIKYADPILWDITSQYEANTIVVDPQTGDAYISTKAVPYGVALSNESYWTRIYNYADAIKTFHEQIAAADEQLSTTATDERAIGALVWLNGLLYRITAPMIAGDSYVVGSNCVKTTIEEELKREMEARAEADTALGERIDDEAEARSDADTALGQRIDDEAEARSDADTALDGRITEIDDIVSNSFTSNYSVNSQEFITEFSTELSEKTSGMYLYNILANGHRFSATVTKQTQYASVFITSYTTQDDTGMLGMWVTRNGSTWVYTDKSSSGIYDELKNKTIQIFGDSLSNENQNPPNWVTKMRDKLPNTVINNDSAGGRTMGGIYTAVSALTELNCDYCIIFAGTNDYNHQIALGRYNTTGFAYSVFKVWERIRELNPTCKIVWITPPHRGAATDGIVYGISCYRACIAKFAESTGGILINGNGFPAIDSVSDDVYQTDGLHFSTEYAQTLCDHIIKNMLIDGQQFIEDVDSEGVLTSSAAISSGRIGYYVTSDGLTLDCYFTCNALSGSSVAINTDNITEFIFDAHQGRFTPREITAFKASAPNVPITCYLRVASNVFTIYPKEEASFDGSNYTFSIHENVQPAWMCRPTLK